jgi:hypothetical protein
MDVYILRRRKLGRTSAREIARMSEHITGVVRNDKPFPTTPDMVIRWGCTSQLDCNNIVNTAAAIQEVGDKSGFRRILQGNFENTGSLLAPKTYFNMAHAVGENAFPLVVRPQYHAQGKNLYVVKNMEELISSCYKCGEGWYASQLINKVAEYRVMFVQGRVAWVAKKTPGNPDAVAWNVALGGKFENVAWGDWPLRAVRISKEAFSLSSLHFGAVDIMVDANGDCFVLEINSAPSQTSPYRQSCMAKCFDYLIRNGKELIPVTEEKGDWKKFIHPALSEAAIAP